MTTYRCIRVGELIQAELADLLLRELKDPRLHMVTISRVEVSNDLRHARVYVSRMGTEEEQQAALAGLQRAAGFIRTQLGKRLKLRYIPQFTFTLDTAIAYGVRISQILRDLSGSDPGVYPESNPSHAERHSQH
jgi:ribosome-binding factor A